MSERLWGVGRSPASQGRVARRTIPKSIPSPSPCRSRRRSYLSCLCVVVKVGSVLSVVGLPVGVLVATRA